MSERPQHLSGRPIRRDDYKRLGFTRRPPEEPLVPGLRPKPTGPMAIGFTARICADDDE